MADQSFKVFASKPIFVHPSAMGVTLPEIVYGNPLGVGQLSIII